MAKNWAIIFGIVFIIVGVVGFIPGGLGIVGPTGVFQTNHIHDAIHLLSGIVILLVGLSAPLSSATVLKVFGFVYLLVSILGFIPGVLDFILLNANDEYLHIVLTIALLWAGYGTGRSMSAANA